MGNTFHHIYNPTEAIADRHHLENLTEQERYVEPRAPKDSLYYRSLDARPDPTLHEAFIKNPFTDIFDQHLNMQRNPVCGKIELGMMNCLEAYGLPNGFYKCRDLMDDYTECLTESKRFKRCKIMRRERARQYRMGEREIKYAMPPKPGMLEL